MRYTVLCDIPETVEHPENGFLVNQPFLGVIDGCSAPYHDEMPPILFNGLTGGQMVRSVILDTLNSAPPNSSLEYVAYEADKEIGWQQGIVASIPLGRADLLAGASFVLAKINETTVEILQGGGCYALWVKKSGEIGITKNQAYESESILVDNFAQLMQKFNGDRKEAWKEHCPFLAEIKQKNTNIAYAELNGQLRVKEFWNKIEIPLSDLDLLICFTDGLVPFSQVGNEKKLAKDIIDIFYQGGLERILTWTRTIEKMEAEHSHQDPAEATGLLIEFI